MKRLLERIREILRNRHNRRAWARIISAIACLVVFFSTYALILPAITMEKNAYCGIEAHQHDDSCYSEELICTIPESEGHTHDDSCYTTHDELSCQLEEHVHGEGCYDEEGNLICELIEHEHDSSCWQEVTELTCGLEESEGHHHTDACYEKVLTCGKEAHAHSEACYELNGPEAAGTAATDARGVVIGGDNSGKPADDKTAEVDVSTVGETDPNAATDSAAVGLTTGAAADPDAYVPTLGELDFNRILNRNTGIYYYHVETAEDAAENQGDAENIGEENKNQGNDQAGEQAKSHPEEINSADIPADAWQKVNKKTVLGENDILRVYFSYTIPAGSLNETNDIARYRLPANLHINDDQIKAINKTENGIAAAFIDYDTLAITDADAYHKYLGVEAVEGTRRPGEIPAEDVQEYISAVVRVENIYNTEGLYGKKDALLGQDLVFTFVPYTVQTNQNTYDAQGDPTSAGETVKGWFTMDLTIDQIDFQPTSSADSSSDSLDLTSGTREAEIVFVEKYKDPAQGIEIDEISTKLVLKDMSGQDIQEQDDSAEDADNPENAENPEQAENVDDADNSEPVGEADVSDVSDKEASAEGDAEKDTETETDLDETNYPAHSFQDSITVRMGSLSTDTNVANAMNASNAENTSTAGEGTASAAAPDIQNRTELTVSVEAEEGTFPEGTTMHLAPVTGSDLDTVAEAVEGAVESRTAGFHAVDITFRDADGNEIEPRKPIKVSMQSESIRQAVENPSTAPVVVHVEDNKKENEKGNLAGNENVNGDGSEADREDEITAETDSSSSSSSNIGLDSATVTGTTVPGSADADNLTFEADSFSVYAIVYTVDFEYSVNGKMYQFSLPGGGFVSFTDLVEVLGIIDDTNAGENGDENGSVIAENGDENGVNEGTEENSVNSDTNTVLTLGDVEVSEATRKFVADVASVEFSSSELVWVGKVEESATVGGLKEVNSLECEYSADLTEEQIAEINAQTVEAGDWALISMQPFKSEESLTVTMKNGDQWTVKVTDDQVTMEGITDGGKYLIYYSTGSGANQTYYVLKNNGDVHTTNSRAELDSLGDEYLWTFDVFDRFGDPYALIHNGSTYLTLNGTVNGIFSNIATPTYMDESGNPIDGFKFSGREWVSTGWWSGYWQNHYLVFNNGSFSLGDENGNNNIKLWEQGTRKYYFTVKTEYSNVFKGTVSGIGWNGMQNNNVASFTSITKNDKTNAYAITATPSEGYHFKEWRLGETVLTEFTSASIPVGALTFTEDNMILTAIFERDEGTSGSGETDYAAIINAWKQQNILSEMNLDKTAHVYDYDNRIYEVDLTADGKATVIAPSMQLAFVTDVSRSMYFPTGLSQASTYSTGYNYNPSSSIVSALNDLRNRNFAGNNSADGDNVYYLIADPSVSSTVYAVRWNPSTQKWMYIDASYDVTKYSKSGASGNGWNVYRSNGDRVGWYVLSEDNHVTYDNGLKLDRKVLDGKIYVASDVRYRLDYLQQAVDAASELVYSVNPSAEIGLVTFAKTANDPVGLYGKNNYGGLLTALHDISPEGGTNQQDGLEKAKQFWSTASDANHQRVVIMVTDGAPNPGNWNNIASTASQLYSQKNATVHTVGLSIENVTGAEAGLAQTARQGGNGKSYSAKNSEQLLNDILDIVKFYLKDANLKGTLHDDIDRIFYPVKQDGTPITPGFYRASDDQQIDLTTVQSYNDPSSNSYGTEYYLWKDNGGQWSITWYNLEFGRGTAANPATHKNFYLKAREDFMGGNQINTNVDEAHAIGSNAVIREGATTKEQPMEVIIDDMAETPHVNVDELHLTEHSTEWTVYLGTDVTPKDQLRALWDNIKVKQVVKEGGTIPASQTDPADVTRITGKDQMWYTHSENNNDSDAPNNSDADAKLPLSYYGLDSYYDALLTAITTGTTYDSGDIAYEPYGHSTIGNFTITATKVIVSGAADAAANAPNQHTTDKAASPAETYKITVMYTPLTNGANTTYTHTTSGGSAGIVTTGTGKDEVKSENTHIIHVYAKTIEVLKLRPTAANTTETLTVPATFGIYRKWKASDGEDKKKSLAGHKLGTATLPEPSSDEDYYFLVEEQTTVNGIAKFTEGLSAADGPYYLAETVPPEGYQQNMTLQTITITTGPDIKTDLEGETTAEPPYNWTQGVKLQIDGRDAVYTDENGAAVELKTEGAARDYVLPDDAAGYYKTSVINEPYASLKLKKQVTINGFSPENASESDKTKADGIYEINMTGTEGTPTEGKSYTVKITISGGEAVSATIKDNTAVNPTEVSATLGADQSVTLPNLIPGQYTLVEADDHKTALIAANSSNDQAAVTDLSNRMLTIHLDALAQEVQLVTLTNNYQPSNEEDVAHISVRKTFAGLKPGDQLPENFYIMLKATAVIDGQTRVFEYELRGATDTGSGVAFNQSVNEDGDVVWNWKISIRGLRPNAAVEIEEFNYNKTGYSVTVSGNPEDDTDGTHYTGTVSAGTIISSYNFDRVITQKNESVFPVYDAGGHAKIFIARLNAQHGSESYPLIISRYRLSLSERAYLESELRRAALPNGGYWLGPEPNKPLYYSFDQAANNMITIRGQRVTYSEEANNPTSGKITFLDQKQWTMVAETSIVYVEGRPADFNFVNSYEEVGVNITILKVNQEHPETTLSGAEFTLRKLNEPDGNAPAPTGNGTFDGTAVTGSPFTTGSNGKIEITGLKSGYYELKEISPPPGYILTESRPEYFVVDSGVVTWIEWSEVPQAAEPGEGSAQDGEPAETPEPTYGWVNKTTGELISFEKETLTENGVTFDHATFTVENEPGSALPHTGGPGTRLYTILGTILILGAGVLLWRRRRLI